jgi:N-acetyl-gamma-glutamyl-phosphate reductase
MLNCAVLGATGYTGSELTRLLLAHRSVRITHLTTRQEKHIPLAEVLPSIPKDVDLHITPYDFEDVKKKADLVFLCLPHTEAMTTGDLFFQAGKIVIDLSADFRLKNPALYPKWYGVEHAFPARLRQAVYGLCEVNREKIKKADLIANPGCYPTGPSLALWPLFKKKMIRTDSVIINAASGVTGAGRKLVTATQYCEVNENYNAYRVNRHQHIPEIEQNCSEAAGKEVLITFVPHLLPVSRGILSTIYVEPSQKTLTEESIRKVLEAVYSQDPFVRIKPAGQFPSLKDVRGTNFCDIGVSLDSRTGRLVILTAIDNLLKGASGQAVQNMNIRCGFPEGAGLV